MSVINISEHMDKKASEGLQEDSEKCWNVLMHLQLGDLRTLNCLDFLVSQWKKAIMIELEKQRKAEEEVGKP